MKNYFAKISHFLVPHRNSPQAVITQSNKDVVLVISVDCLSIFLVYSFSNSIICYFETGPVYTDLYKRSRQRPSSDDQISNGRMNKMSLIKSVKGGCVSCVILFGLRLIIFKCRSIDGRKKACVLEQTTTTQVLVSIKQCTILHQLYPFSTHFQ